ncbi:kinase-like protein, partial [Trifolium medium]|nr:kinase-like protein [Trifolium medium]
MTGEIPTNLSSCSDLAVLSLRGNHFIGKIPIGISSLHNLQWLSITNNNLTGRIPSFIGNLSSLTTLGMGTNHLRGKYSTRNVRPQKLDKNAALNDFNGSLPLNMFNTLSNLQQFYIEENQFSGTIPVSIANASTLQKLDL